MYFDKKRNRVLLRDGSSVLTPHEFSSRLLKGEDVSLLHVIDTEDSRAYDLVYHTKTSKEIEEIDVEPSSHIASDEAVDSIIQHIISSDRYEPHMDERVEFELDYFLRTNNITFLGKCIELVEQMKRDGVVWGVGRGSACASLIMFLIEMNDINPLKYDIPFSEMSKEQMDF